MYWWIGIGAVLLLIFLWFAGSYLYLKLRYHALSEAERRRYSDLEKEQRTPQSGSM